MKGEKERISSTQLVFFIIGLAESETLTSAFISSITKQNTWIVWLIGFVIILGMLFIYTTFSSKFPGKSLVEINDLAYGRFLGKIISTLYIMYFMYVLAANFRFIADFFATYLFSEVHINVFVIGVLLVSIYALKKGLEVITRSVTVIAIISTLVFITVTILTLKDVKLLNFLPMLQIKPKEFIQGVNLMVCIPIGEIIVFLMIFPCVNDIKQVKKSTFLGYIIGNMIFLMIILRNISVLGNINALQSLPSYQVAKLINIADIITRMEVLIALVLLFDEFLKICIFYYATVVSTAQIFKLKDYKILVIPIGIISAVFSISMFNSDVEHVQYASSIYPIYTLLFIIIFPLLSFIIVSIKKHK